MDCYGLLWVVMDCYGLLTPQLVHCFKYQNKDGAYNNQSWGNTQQCITMPHGCVYPSCNSTWQGHKMENWEA